MAVAVRVGVVREAAREVARVTTARAAVMRAVGSGVRAARVMAARVVGSQTAPRVVIAGAAGVVLAACLG